jgi:hypothetical protein
VTVVVRHPGPPLAGLVTEMVYRTGEQPRASVEKILPGPGTGLWVNLNRGVTPTGYLLSRVNGPNHLRFDVRS